MFDKGFILSSVIAPCKHIQQVLLAVTMTSIVDITKTFYLNSSAAGPRRQSVPTGVLLRLICLPLARPKFKECSTLPNYGWMERLDFVCTGIRGHPIRARAITQCHVPTNSWLDHPFCLQTNFGFLMRQTTFFSIQTAVCSFFTASECRDSCLIIHYSWCHASKTV